MRITMRLCYLGIILSPCLAFGQYQLTITPSMIINTSARGDAWVLFDEQKVVHPCLPTTPQLPPQAVFDATWNGQHFFYPVSVVVDLGTTQTLTRICLEEGHDSKDEVRIALAQDPADWEETDTHQARANPCKDLSHRRARYLRLTFASPQARIREVKLFGAQPNAIICPPPPLLHRPQYRPMRDMIGVNTNVDVPPSKTLPFGVVRNYQGIFSNIGGGDPNTSPYPNNEYAWSPSHSGTLDFDRFFEDLKDMGKTVTATIHRAPPYLVTFRYHNGDINYNAASPFAAKEISLTQFYNSTERKPFSERYYPIESGMILDDPNAYLEYADIFYQFAARYGRQLATQPLKIQADNRPLSGLGYIDYLENWNEPDKWWHIYLTQELDYLDPAIEQELGYFRPSEYAALSIATIDGNGQREDGVQHIVRHRYQDCIPDGAFPVGVYAADSTMRMVMAGISELKIDYVRAVQFWLNHHRPDLGFPFRAISFHHYSNNSQVGQSIGQHAIAPEADRLREKLVKLVDYRNRYLPGVELWLSEFGYDTHPRSPQSPDCEHWCDDCDAPDCLDKMKELQGQWIVRSFLEIAAAGVDRAMVFTARDGSSEQSNGLYATAGLTTWGKDGYRPKPAWYYVATMQDVLGNSTYDPSFQSLDPRIRMYRFIHSDGSHIYAIWSPTSWRGDDSPIYIDYPLDFISSDASVIRLQSGEADGLRQKMSSCGGIPCVSIGERPIFIVSNNATTDEPGCNCNYLGFNVWGEDHARYLADERARITGVYCEDTIVLQTTWQPKIGEEVLIDFGKTVSLSDLFIQVQPQHQGRLQISYGRPSAWNVWQNWDSVQLDEHGWKRYREDIITTRYLRLTAQDSLLRLGGLAVCGRGGIPDPYLLTASEVIHSVDSWDRCSLNITHKKIYMPPSADGLFYLYDISGRQVYSGNLKRRIGEVAVFSTYALAAGVYWLRWEENSGTVKSQRIVVGE